MSSIQATASSAVSGIGGAWDNAKLTTFVAAFRTAYPNLSSDRDDESIESIVKETCTAIDSGASDEQLSAKVKETAANDGTVPTDDQVDRILQLVRPACRSAGRAEPRGRSEPRGVGGCQSRRQSAGAWSRSAPGSSHS